MDELAARWLPRGVREVIVASGAGRAVLAEDRARGVRTTLVQDLPLLRRMQAAIAAQGEGCSCGGGSR